MLILEAFALVVPGKLDWNVLSAVWAAGDIKPGLIRVERNMGDCEAVGPPCKVLPFVLFSI